MFSNSLWPVVILLLVFIYVRLRLQTFSINPTGETGSETSVRTDIWPNVSSNVRGLQIHIENVQTACKLIMTATIMSNVFDI